ncbi:hypothetical protein LXA43DRAFT_1067452 [Ganoderma leucocontextum]|nr:hypothetical protein LXA43DRAFT_1067452 [Ganoderma leucocontextum]
MPCWDATPTADPKLEDLAVWKQLVCDLASRGSDELDVMEDPLRSPPVREQTHETGRVPDLTARYGISRITRDMSCVAWAIQAVTAPSMFQPILPTISAEPEPSTVAEKTAPQDSRVKTPPKSTVEALCEGSTDDTNGSPGLAGSVCKGKRWIKYTLASGLVIEVEATGPSGLAESQAEFASQPTSHTPVIVRTASPEPPYGYDSHLQSDDAAESVTTWFDSFASNALAAAETFLKQLTDGYPSFTEWSGICKEIMRDGRLFYKYPDGPGSSGLFDTVFILAPLSGHMRAIRGGTRIEVYSFSDSGYPFGAIGLAAAAVLLLIVEVRHSELCYYSVVNWSDMVKTEIWSSNHQPAMARDLS